jgi:hypothetical protein
MSLNNKIHIRLTLIINLNKILKSNNSQIKDSNLNNNYVLEHNVLDKIRKNMPYKTWTIENMKNAIRAVKTEGYTVKNAAQTFSIPISTLFLYLKNKHKKYQYFHLKSINRQSSEENRRKYSISLSDKKLQTALNIIRTKELSKIKSKMATQRKVSEIEDYNASCSSAYSTNNKDIQFVKEFFVEFTIGKYQQSKRLNLRNNFIDLDNDNNDFDVKLHLNDINNEFESDLISNKLTKFTNNSKFLIKIQLKN